MLIYLSGVVLLTAILVLLIAENTALSMENRSVKREIVYLESKLKVVLEGRDDVKKQKIH